jgi:hypothetical protein
MKTDMMPQLKATEDKIINGLNKEEKAPGPLSFPFFLAKVLVKEDFHLLGLLEEEIGEEHANGWLCSVMARSGKYTMHSDGTVTVK